MLVEEVKSVEIDYAACAFADLAEGALAQGTDLAEDARDGDPLGAEYREPILREQACGGREKREVALELGSGVVPGRTAERRIGFFNALFLFRRAYCRMFKPRPTPTDVALRS
jgi:hypothetical protein